MKKAELVIDYDFSMRFAIQEIAKKATDAGIENYSITIAVRGNSKDSDGNEIEDGDLANGTVTLIATEV